MPIEAMNEKVVPVTAKNRNTPNTEKTIEPRMIASGNSIDSNSAAMTRKMQAMPSRMFWAMSCCVSS